LIAGDLAFFSLIAPAQNVAECDQATGPRHQPDLPHRDGTER
jgi:hypothetical protein